MIYRQWCASGTSVASSVPTAGYVTERPLSTGRASAPWGLLPRPVRPHNPSPRSDASLLSRIRPQTCRFRLLHPFSKTNSTFEKSPPGVRTGTHRSRLNPRTTGVALRRWPKANEGNIAPVTSLYVTQTRISTRKCCRF